jgi:molybdenum cofactor cytidylyltransferase
MFAAVVLAAGCSTRMGRPKLVLPWGNTTVIGQVVTTLMQAGVTEIVVVTGGARAEVEAALAGFPVRMVFNARYQEDAMLLSLQVGLRTLKKSQSEGALIILGDQPHLKGEVLQGLLAAYTARRAPLVVPSFQYRRGHPWVLERSLWAAALGAAPSTTLRDFLNQHAAQIEYVNVDNDSILNDLDYPEDYARLHP